MIKTCAVVGTGLAARAMVPALVSAGIDVRSVSGRNLDRASEVAAVAGCEALSLPQVSLPAQMILLCVTDAAIEQVTVEISHERQLAGTAVVHLAGAAGLDVLSAAAQSGARVGKFHPIASLSGGPARLPGSVFGIAGDESLMFDLADLAERLGGTALDVSHVDLRLYHLAAVFASNLTLGIIEAALRLWTLSGAPLPAHEALLPLMRGTLDNWQSVGLEHALTGPIQRGDVRAVARQVNTLRGESPELEEAYRALSRILADVALRANGPVEDNIAEIARYLAEKSLID